MCYREVPETRELAVKLTPHPFTASPDLRGSRIVRAYIRTQCWFKNSRKHGSLGGSVNAVHTVLFKFVLEESAG